MGRRWGPLGGVWSPRVGSRILTYRSGSSPHSRRWRLRTICGSTGLMSVSTVFARARIAAVAASPVMFDIAQMIIDLTLGETR